MLAASRGGGDVAGCACSHEWPSQAHVSASESRAPSPPNSTACPWTGSYAIASANLGVGIPGVGGAAALDGPVAPCCPDVLRWLIQVTVATATTADTVRAAPATESFRCLCLPALPSRGEKPARPVGVGCAEMSARYAQRRTSVPPWSVSLMVDQVLPQGGQCAGEVAADRAWSTADHERAFIERIAVVVVEGEHGSLALRERAEEAIHVDVTGGHGGRDAVEVEPEEGQSPEAATGAQRLPDADPGEPGRSRAAV